MDRVLAGPLIQPTPAESMGRLTPTDPHRQYVPSWLVSLRHPSEESAAPLESSGSGSFSNQGHCRALSAIPTGLTACLHGSHIDGWHSLRSQVEE